MRTLQRWGDDREDGRHGPKSESANKLSATERQRIVAAAPRPAPTSIVDLVGWVLHANNGGPMEGATMLATMQRLGVVPPFSRPSVSNDNPFSESLSNDSCVVACASSSDTSMPMGAWTPARPFGVVTAASWRAAMPPRARRPRRVDASGIPDRAAICPITHLRSSSGS